MSSTPSETVSCPPSPQQLPPGIWKQLGPGVISGAANDDPSCIVSYSMAGAAFGYLTLWTSLYFLPLVAAAQLMSSRLGMVTGRGLAGDVRVNCPRWMLLLLCCGLVAANIVTIGADLGGMAEVTQMLTGVSALIWIAVYGIGITAVLFFFSYAHIERVLRWLCLGLFAYLIAAVLSHPDWSAVVSHTVVPRVEWSGQYLEVLVAILGATVSPYFLFWQAAAEVEAEYCLGRRTVASRRGTTARALKARKVDVYAGSLVSKLITFAITLTTAAALFAHGHKQIGTAKDAAAALEPVAGRGAYWLFALGVIGTGLIAVPVLAGSSAYAVSEALRWRASLEEKPRLVPKFYGVVAASMAAGLALLYFRFPVVQMLFWASVLNGLLAPVCLLLLVRLTSRPDVMGTQINPPWLSVLGWTSVLITGSSALAMLVSLLQQWLQ